jgi:hypothetical protein
MTGAEEFIWREETTGFKNNTERYIGGKPVGCRVVVTDGREPQRGLRVFFCLFRFRKFIGF